MSWRGSQIESRSRHLTHYGIEEVDRYESWVSKLGDEDDEACLSDLRPEFEFRGGMSVLDVGAGTGAMSKVLYRVAGLSITALEPSPHMIAKLRAKPELRNVRVVCGFSDSHADLPLFDTLSFDAIVSRQLLNGLFDPLTAFRNWNQWLKPNGTLIVIDGLYDRPDWTGELKCELGVLPFSACRTMAMAPYLLQISLASKGWNTLSPRSHLNRMISIFSALPHQCSVGSVGSGLSAFECISSRYDRDCLFVNRIM